MAAPRPLSIGTLVAVLREDYPDLTVSKVRFLEAEGLVSPARTASGYRQFTSADLERVRFILRAQREWYWPLRVVRDNLDAMDRGLDPGTPSDPTPRLAEAVPDSAGPSVPEQRSVVGSVRLSAAELAQASGLSRDGVAELVSYGLLTPDEHGWFDSGAVVVARSAAALASYGVQARHLRVVRAAADRVEGLVEQALGSRRGADLVRADREVRAEICAMVSAMIDPSSASPPR